MTGAGCVPPCNGLGRGRLLVGCYKPAETFENRGRINAIDTETGYWTDR